MAFVFIGIDGVDYSLARKFDFLNLGDGEVEDCPVELDLLCQDMPEVISEKGSKEDLTGLWTFYLWGAMARGMVDTPEMRQEHPLPSEVNYPLSTEYFEKGESSRPRDQEFIERNPYFVWDEFENVKVINYPITMPEFCKNAELFRNDAISRNYGPTELKLLATEINNALNENYDAVFVVTRYVDTFCHGATQPGAYQKDSMDAWIEDVMGRSFEDWHEGGMCMEDVIEEEKVDVSEEQELDKQKLLDEVWGHLQTVYDSLEEFFTRINWEEVDDYTVVSDHGFERIGGGSVQSHSREAVVDCSFARFQYMSGFIENFRPSLVQHLQEVEDDKSGEEENGKISSGEEFEGKSKDEEVKEKLEELGYNT